MSWQKCPICDGTGKMNGSYISCTEISCPTCQGYRIIDEVTGLPPEYGKEDKQVDDSTKRFLEIAGKIRFPHEINK